MLADDRNRLGRSHVVSRAPVFLTRDAVEVLFDDLLAPGESVTSAHAEIIADRLNPSAAIGSHHPLTAICALAGDLCNDLAVF